MIDINLMPSDTRKKNVSGFLSSFCLGLPQDIIIGLGVAFIALLAVIHIFLIGFWGVTAVSLSMQKSAWAKILPDKERMDSLGNQIKDTKKKTDSLAEIVSPKATGWSRKFNILSDALSNGVWLRKITLDNKALVLEGTAMAKNQNEVSLVSSFVDNLKKQEFFMHDVSSIDVGNIARTKKGSTDVANFTLTVRLTNESKK